MNGTACAIGSLPHSDAKAAVKYIIEDFKGIPFWPQLPKRTYLENFYVQYSEGLPGRVLDIDKGHIHFDTESRIDEVSDFYERFLADDIDSFAISKEYAAGLAELLRVLSGQKLPLLKGHVTGGISFALSVNDQYEKLLAYDVNFFDIVVKGCVAKGLWQANLLKPYTDELILFFDEPSLVGYGSAFVQITGEQIRQALRYTVDTIHGAGAITGIHCCANTDWALIMESGTDILSFDAFSFFDHLLLYEKELSAFYANGGQVAFGIVPTDDQVFSLSENDLLRKLVEQVNAIEKIGVDKDKILHQSFITPACGLGTSDENLAERALSLTSKTAKAFRDHFQLKSV